jgi:proline iminopeptidase
MAFDADPSAAGMRRIPVRPAHGTFEVWTRRSGTSPTIKLLLLDGGPSCTHEAFEVFESVPPQAGIELLYYDQLGSHHSSQPDPPDLWEIDRFVNEVWSRCARPGHPGLDARCVHPAQVNT